ncbi:epoxide hydrolase [Lentzea guizhouensis]|uniref:Epoxide hydrolase n=1 Tax=Lentzea guizhouensis TaxID=1586287 RepID=A0A1B2HSS4_9PSEU|nr:epoxide hydrolase family protein [Lentzea guizhouensis]ANZ40735.1 epoxide hydrolase [Lentzea guizhouensis]
MTEIRDFRVAVDAADVDELKLRLARTRWTDQVPGAGDLYGDDVAKVQELARYWAEEFDWGAVQERLNSFPQFVTEVDGANVHFLHVRSENPDAVPLLMVHGWPGTVLEFVDVIEHLREDFHLVVPSTPGVGFSGPTTERGWHSGRIARAYAELMSRLGYERYGVHGNDAGSIIGPEVGRVDPEHVVGVHVTQIFSFPSGDPAEMEGLTEDDFRRLGVLQNFWETMSGYAKLQQARPQNVAFGLADSPVGQLAWILQLMGEPAVSRDFLLANVSVYWFTNTAGSSARLYFEDAHREDASSEPTTFPMGVAIFPDDFQTIRRFAERDHHNLVHWSEFERGGHYSGHEAPDLLANDLKVFFAKL